MQTQEEHRGKLFKPRYNRTELDRLNSFEYEYIFQIIDKNVLHRNKEELSIIHDGSGYKPAQAAMHVFWARLGWITTIHASNSNDLRRTESSTFLFNRFESNVNKYERKNDLKLPLYSFCWHP